MKYNTFFKMYYDNINVYIKKKLLYIYDIFHWLVAHCSCAQDCLLSIHPPWCCVSASLTRPRHLATLRCMVTGTRSAELRHCAGLSDYTPPEKKKQEVVEDTRDGALSVAVAERDGVGDAGGRSEQDVHMSDGENAYCEMLTRGGWGEGEAW